MGDNLKHNAINAFILFHLALIVALSIPPYFPFMKQITRLVTAYSWRAGLYQNWSMFAPDPRHWNVYVKAEIIDRDGQTRAWVFPQMNELGYAKRYAKERYRKFSNDNLWSDDNAVLWPDAARYIARINATPSHQPAFVKLIYYWATIPTIPARGEAAPQEQYRRHLFFTYTVKPEDLMSLAPVLRSAVRAWDGFFFTPQSPTPIALYRILYGLLVIATLALQHDDWMAWYGVRGFMSMETMRKVAPGIKPSIFLILPWNDSWIPAFFWVFMCFAVLLTVGLFSRFCSIAVFAALSSLYVRNTYIWHSGDRLLALTGFFLIFAPSGAALSLDRLWRIWRGKEGIEIQPRPPWAQRMIQIQASFVYISTFLWKMRGAEWVNGTAVYYTSRAIEFQRFPMPVLENGLMLRLATWSALAIEGLFGVVVWIRKLRYWMLLIGIGLHLSLEYSMNVPLFQWIAMAIYVTFVDPADLTRARDWVTRHLPGKPVKVTYDGTIPRDVRRANVLRAIDVFGRLNLVDRNDSGASLLNRSPSQVAR